MERALEDDRDRTFAPVSDEFATIAGNLYARWTLDCLADLAYAVANDAISRPELYQSNDIPDEVVSFRMSYGTAPHFPALAQRQAMMMPIIGPSDGRRYASTAAPAASPPSFPIARQKFVDACTAFAQQASDVEGPLLENRVRSAAGTLRAHFHGVRGKSFALSVQQVDALSSIAVRILTSPGVSHVFGIGHLHSDWPFRSNDPNGAKLIESIGRSLPLSADCQLTFTDFLLLQRIAEEGSKAIELLLATENFTDKELRPVISAGYTWGASLREGTSSSPQPLRQTTPASRATPPVTRSARRPMTPDSGSQTGPSLGS